MCHNLPFWCLGGSIVTASDCSRRGGLLHDVISVSKRAVLLPHVRRWVALQLRMHVPNLHRLVPHCLPHVRTIGGFTPTGDGELPGAKVANIALEEWMFGA